LEATPSKKQANQGLIKKIAGVTMSFSYALIFLTAVLTTFVSFNFPVWKMDVLLSGPHDSVSDSCVKKVCLQAREKGVKSNFIGSNLVDWLDLLRSLMAQHSSAKKQRNCQHSSVRFRQAGC